MPEQTVSAQEASLTVQVAAEIRAWMGRHKMSQRALAAELGLSPASMHARIHGTQEIGLNELDQIAKALGVTVQDLMPATAAAGAA